MVDRPALSASKYHQLGDGMRMRYAVYEPTTPRATLLVAPGRREFIEKKYAEMGPQFLERGFRLIFFEWRGQGLSDRFVSGTKHQHDHITDFRTHLGDLSSFYEKIVHPLQTGPLILSGHSMGGHLIVRWLIERPTKVAAVLLTAPMLALASLPVHTVARGISWAAVRLGHNTDYGPGQHDYGPSDRAFDNNPLTQDLERFRIIENYFDAFPAMTIGGVTWGWLDAALKSMHWTHQKYYFERLKIPVLSMTGGKDRVTPAVELMRHLQHMPFASNFVIQGARHDVMNEADLYRNQAWRYIDAFLGKTLKL